MLIARNLAFTEVPPTHLLFISDIGGAYVMGKISETNPGV